MKSESCLSFKQKMQLDGSKILSRICRALNLDRRESIMVLLRICRRQKIDLDGSRIYRESISQTKSSKFFSMDRRSCQDSIEKKPRNLDGSRICRGSIEKRERMLDRKESVEELLSQKKEGFSREEKNIKMNATNKLLKQRSRQHIKLSKHLSTYMQSIHRSKHTHTHTLNKSNQFYISKIS